MVTGFSLGQVVHPTGPQMVGRLHSLVQTETSGSQIAMPSSPSQLMVPTSSASHSGETSYRSVVARWKDARLHHGEFGSIPDIHRPPERHGPRDRSLRPKTAPVVRPDVIAERVTSPLHQGHAAEIRDGSLDRESGRNESGPAHTFPHGVRRIRLGVLMTSCVTKGVLWASRPYRAGDSIFSTHFARQSAAGNGAAKYSKTLITLSFRSSNRSTKFQTSPLG